MSLFNDLLRGMIFLSIMAIIQNGCTPKDMANQAVESHKNGLTQYGDYSRMLTGSQDFWVKRKQ